MTACEWFRWVGTLSDSELDDLRWEQYAAVQVAPRDSREHEWAKVVIRLLDLIRDDPENVWMWMAEVASYE